MSLLSDLSPKQGSKHSPKRVGRGIGSGMGGTSTKGHKGQLARTGGKVRRGFEGGQTPLTRRLPKFGFSNVNFSTKYAIVNLESLVLFDGEVSPEILLNRGLIKNRDLVKILGKGNISKPLFVKAHHFSASAKAAIEQAGGRIEVLK